MTEVWEEMAPKQRLNELIDLLKEQKEKDQAHEIREDDVHRKSEERDVRMAELIDMMARHMLDLEKRVEALEKNAKH
jgi:hypothetical protein